MEFVTTHAPPFPIKINGKPYDVPRFLLRQVKEWAVNRQNAAKESALAVLPDADARARFLLYHQPPAVDVAYIAQLLTASEGIEHIVRDCLKRANVPAEDITGLLENADPLLIRRLADELRSGNGVIADQLASSGDPGAAGNPPTGQSHTSGDSPETTATTSPTG